MTPAQKGHKIKMTSLRWFDCNGSYSNPTFTYDYKSPKEMP